MGEKQTVLLGNSRTSYLGFGKYFYSCQANLSRDHSVSEFMLNGTRSERLHQDQEKPTRKSIQTLGSR